jgi:Fic family protein
MITPPPPSWTTERSPSLVTARTERVIAAFRHVPGPTVGERYHHWHKLRHLSPPGGLTHEVWWDALKFRRMAARRTPLLSTSGASFGFLLVDPALRMLHEVDSRARGQIEFDAQVATEENRDRYLVSSISEEAISSSLLEGAVTTRRKAKELLASQREPRTLGERMVLNNYAAMNWIRGRKEEPLTPRIVLELQRRLTAGTLEDPDAEGRLRRAVEDEHVVLRALDSADVVHTPPPAGELEKRLEQMCAWANDNSRENFVHPVVRSIVLHFWLAYDHPFVDGNGRTARALFYWSMVRHGYWLAEFLPISRLFLKAPAKYANAFQYVETDDNDLTYFILFHLGVLVQALEDLELYLARKSREAQAVTKLLRASAALNHRQVALLAHALQHADTDYTIDAHRHSHAVVYQSARTDLLDLEERGLLRKRRVGRKFVFSAVDGLESRLKRLR